MADFGYLSDTDDSAVEELLSQARELSALEQVAAINCSGFTDSTLPDDLESRFRRLKSTPLQPVSSKNGKSVNKQNPGKSCGSLTLSDDDSSIFRREKLNRGVEKAGIVSDGSGDLSDSGNFSLSSSRESKIFSPVKRTQKLPKEKRRIGSTSSSSVDIASPISSDPDTEKRVNLKSKSKSKSSSSWLHKLSPSKIIGFICRSPEKSSTKKKTIKSSKSFSAAGRERDIDFDEFLSDLNAYSVEDQRKMLKKALKEQQKMRREAAEFIKMAKQASAKFDFDD